MSEVETPRATQAIGVLIVAEVRLYREGLSASLGSRPQLRILGTSAARDDARARVHELAPEVVVIDVATRESLDLIRDIRAESGATQILAFAVAEVIADIIDCAESGAAGYVTADASLDDLVSAIERIARQELVCSPRIAAKLFGRFSERGPRGTDVSDVPTLTSRERQVLEFIKLGYSNKEIAQKLNIAEPTVKNHVHHLLEKLEVTTRAQAAARAMLPASRRRPFAAVRYPTREIG